MQRNKGADGQGAVKSLFTSLLSKLGSKKKYKLPRSNLASAGAAAVSASDEGPHAEQEVAHTGADGAVAHKQSVTLHEKATKTPSTDQLAVNAALSNHNQVDPQLDCSAPLDVASGPSKLLAALESVQHSDTLASANVSYNAADLTGVLFAQRTQTGPVGTGHAVPARVVSSIPSGGASGAASGAHALDPRIYVAGGEDGNVVSGHIARSLVPLSGVHGTYVPYATTTVGGMQSTANGEMQETSVANNLQDILYEDYDAVDRMGARNDRASPAVAARRQVAVQSGQTIPQPLRQQAIQQAAQQQLLLKGSLEQHPARNTTGPGTIAAAVAAAAADAQQQSMSAPLVPMGATDGPTAVRSGPSPGATSALQSAVQAQQGPRSAQASPLPGSMHQAQPIQQPDPTAPGAAMQATGVPRPAADELGPDSQPAATAGDSRSDQRSVLRPAAAGTSGGTEINTQPEPISQKRGVSSAVMPIRGSGMRGIPAVVLDAADLAALEMLGTSLPPAHLTGIFAPGNAEKLKAKMDAQEAAAKRRVAAAAAEAAQDTRPAATPGDSAEPSGRGAAVAPSPHTFGSQPAPLSRPLKLTVACLGAHTTLCDSAADQSFHRALQRKMQMVYKWLQGSDLSVPPDTRLEIPPGPTSALSAALATEGYKPPAGDGPGLLQSGGATAAGTSVTVAGAALQDAAVATDVAAGLSGKNVVAAEPGHAAKQALSSHAAPSAPDARMPAATGLQFQTVTNDGVRQTPQPQPLAGPGHAHGSASAVRSLPSPAPPSPSQLRSEPQGSEHVTQRTTAGLHETPARSSDVEPGQNGTGHAAGRATHDGADSPMGRAADPLMQSFGEYGSSDRQRHNPQDAYKALQAGDLTGAASAHFQSPLDDQALQYSLSDLYGSGPAGANLPPRVLANSGEAFAVQRAAGVGRHAVSHEHSRLSGMERSSGLGAGAAAGEAGRDSSRQHGSTPPARTKTIAVASHCPLELQPQPSAATWTIDDFTLLRKLYEGSLSVVCQAQHKRSGRHVALKIYKRSRLHEMERFQLAREICLHIRIVHPHVVALYAAWKDSKYVYLALEWAPQGNMFDFLVSRGGRLSEEEAALVVVRPLMSALAFLHSQFFIHRDIKLENLLLDASCSLKLADFGLAIDQKFEQANTRLGTFGYFAPEVLDCPLKKGPFDLKDASVPGYDSRVDVWSAGVVGYEVLTGRAPFSATSPAKIIQAIRTRPLDFPGISEEGADFLRQALTRDPALRPTAKQLLNHPWILRHCGRVAESPVPAPALSGPLGVPTDAPPAAASAAAMAAAGAALVDGASPTRPQRAGAEPEDASTAVEGAPPGAVAPAAVAGGP